MRIQTRQNALNTSYLNIITKNFLLGLTKAVGGEFYFNLSDVRKNYGSLERFINGQTSYKNYGFFAGGSYAIKWILRDLKTRLKTATLLLPSYLCQSIITAVESEGVNFEFYSVDKELNLNLDEINARLQKPDVVLYLINYFGFGQKDSTLQLVKKAKEKYNTLVIEDDVQSCFSSKKPYGDYLFNSFKKWHSVDGSIVFSNFKLPEITVYDLSYLRYRKATRSYRYLQQELGLPVEQLYLDSVENASKEYLKPELFGMHGNDKKRFNQINLERQKSIRRKNFHHLLEALDSIALFKEIPEYVVPFSFPVTISNRNHKRTELFEENIYCPIHWNTPVLLKNKYPESELLSDSVLSIPINKTLTSETIGTLSKILLS